MTVLICLLRGVNVGAHNRIKMEELRAVCSACKLCDVETYVQSGNIVFRSREGHISKLTKRLEDAFEKKFGFRSVVVLRTAAELREVIRRNPFAGRTEIEPGKLLVTFFATDPGEEARAKLRAVPTNPEELRIDGRELYIHYPEGAGRSKLNAAVIDRALKISGTARNWNTVTQLMKMAEKLEAYK